MEIKPIQIKAVAPISVKPISPVAPVVKAPPIKVQQEANPDEVYGQLFGGSTQEEKTETPGDVPTEDVVNDIKKTAKAAVDKAVENIKEKEEESTKKETKPKAKPKEKKYEGPREVRVYGMTLWTEEDNSVTLDDIRKKIVEEYHFPEFSADRTIMSFDDKTGIIVPVIKFEKKG